MHVIIHQTVIIKKLSNHNVKIFKTLVLINIKKRLWLILKINLKVINHKKNKLQPKGTW